MSSCKIRFCIYIQRSEITTNTTRNSRMHEFYKDTQPTNFDFCRHKAMVPSSRQIQDCCSFNLRNKSCLGLLRAHKS